jgi:hypothetical protein
MGILARCFGLQIGVGTGPSIFMLFLAAMASSNSGVAFRPLRPTVRCSSGAPPEPDQTIDLKARAV